MNTFARINSEVIEHSMAYATLREATSTIGHRLTGTDNGRRAEEFVFKKFKEYGYDDVRFDEFEVQAWSRGTLTVTIDGKQTQAVSLGHSPVVADVAGEIVDAGNGLEVDFAKPAKFKGKIALMYLGILEGSGDGVRNLHRKDKTANAIHAGAIGVIFYNSVGHGVLLTGTASTNGQLIPIPAVSISKENGMALRDRLKIASVAAHIQMTNNNNQIVARNVVATLKGTTMPSEKIVVAGHLDSWDLATGAIDNGIGSFAVLDIARTFKAARLQPIRTIEFVMFMGEEQGLLGSHHRVDGAVASGSIDSVRYMMNIDMGGNPVGIHAMAIATDTAFFQQLGAEIRSIDTVFTNKFRKTPGLHSDHEPYLLEGIPVIGIVSNLDKSVYDCYHSDCDNFNLVNEEHIRNTVRFGTMILYALSTSPVLPASRMDSETTRQYLIDNHLKDELVISGEWRWKQAP